MTATLLLVVSLWWVGCSGQSSHYYDYTYSPSGYWDCPGCTSYTTLADMSFSFSAGTAVDAVLVLHVGRTQQTSDALSHVRLLIDGAEVAEKIVGIVNEWHFAPFVMYAFVSLSAGVHSAEVQVKTAGLFQLHNDGVGMSSRFFGILKAPAGSVYTAALDASETLPSSGSFVSLPTDLSVTVTVSQTVSLLLLLDIERLQNTVSLHAVVRIAVGGAEACSTNLPVASGDHFRGLELACTVEVAAGTHVVRVQYKTGSTGVSVEARRRLFALVLDQEDMRVSESTSLSVSQVLASSTYASLSPDLTVTVTTSQAATLWVFAHLTRIQAYAASTSVTLHISVGSQVVCESSVGDHYDWNYAAPVVVGAAVVPAGTHTVRVEYRVAVGTSLAGGNADGDCTGSLSVLALYSAGGECATDLGLASGAIPDAHMTANNKHDSAHGPERARLTNTVFPAGWAANIGASSWYLTVDLGLDMLVSAVAVRGRPDANQWATAFKVQYGSILGVWVDYEESSSWHVFKGVSDNYCIHRRSFLAPVTARFIRIHIVSYHNFPVLRAELYGCGCVTNDAIPLGVETGAATLSASTASVAAVNGILNGGSAWVAGVTDTSQYLEVDLGKFFTLDYVGTQGHAGSVAWVTQYKVDYSADGTSWSTVLDPSGNEVVFMGNTNQLTVVRNPVRVYARYVRVRPMAWRSMIAMRVEMYSCFVASVIGDPEFTSFDGASRFLDLRPGIFNLFTSSAVVVNAYFDVIDTLPAEENTVMVMVGIVVRSDVTSYLIQCHVARPDIPEFVMECFHSNQEFLSFHPTDVPPLGIASKHDYSWSLPGVRVQVLGKRFAVITDDTSFAPSNFLDVRVQLLPPLQGPMGGLIPDIAASGFPFVFEKLSEHFYDVDNCLWSLPAGLVNVFPSVAVPC